MKAILSHAAYVDLRRQLDGVAGRGLTHDLLGGPLSVVGMDVEVSNLFPSHLACQICSGTGHGTTSTYCKPCRGGGATIVDDVMGDFRPRNPVRIVV